MITSGQLFEKVSCSVIPNNWKLNHILLTLRDIVNYYCGQVLKTLKQAAYNAPVSCVFFSSEDYLRPSVRLIKDLIRQGIRQPSCFGFEPSVTSPSERAVLNQNINKEANNG